MTQIDSTVWATIHEAASKLHAARRGETITLGDDGISDAFGGSYFAAHYEGRGLAGLFEVRRALERITQHAWALVHGARDRVRAVEALQLSGWIAYRHHGRHLVPVRGDHGNPQVFATRSAAVRVAGNGDRVRSGAQVERERIESIEDECRVAVRTMLAARALYDALVTAGACVETVNQISSGTCEGRVLLTGLRWLAGQRSETESPTVEQCARFALGESAAESFT